MRDRLLAVVVLSLALAALYRAWSIARARRISRDRLRLDEVEAEPEEVEQDEPPPARPFQVRHRWVPWAAAGLVFVAINFVVGLKTSYAVMFGVIVGLLIHELEDYLASRKDLLIETQLADAIDLMVASLRAGASLMSSLETAVDESRVPLRPQLEEVLGRIRYGDDPLAVLRGLMGRVPLETFRLFASALMVHEEVGGSLAPTLATVGRIIRDRIELTRRIRSLTVQSRTSTVAILGTTYFIAMIMWRTDPDRMEEFLSSNIGSTLTSGAVMLQAIGVFWTSWLSRLKY
jgi:Flp pilus assembly protein TadB